MSKIKITNKLLHSLKPSVKPTFIRDLSQRGFGVKVNPSGSIKYIVETRHRGKTVRRTLGEFGLLELSEARQQAIYFLADMKYGKQVGGRKHKTLRKLFDEYISEVRLKERTIVDYREAVTFYLGDWLDKPIAEIDKYMVEGRFKTIRDKGINGGIPTYSQATKTMRILSALMNYAMADDLIESNPVNVQKQKRIDRSIKKRDNYLPFQLVHELIQKTSEDSHPVTLAINLMVHTGLRKNEALTLRWDDLQTIDGIKCIVIQDTKNHRPNYVPVTSKIDEVLIRAKNCHTHVFPSPQRRETHIGDVRPTLKRLSALIGTEFKCHDLRRTFATRASEVGIDFLMIKRLLNHKSNDITSQYIQWTSKANLELLKNELEKVVY